MFQHVLVEACRAEDPPSRLRDLVEQHAGELSVDEQRALGNIDEDGLHLTSIIVKKLRFERIIGGDPELRAEFDRGPEEFTALFKRYLTEERPRSVFPEEEARAFVAWRGP